MIGGKMLASGGYGCVFSPAINCDGSILESKKYVSKVQVYNKYAIREIKIGKKISKISGYLNHFVPVIKHCEVKLGKIEDKEKDRCDIFKKKSSKKFTTMKMPFINGLDFIDFMISHKDSKFIINNLISSYNHLLVSLIKMTQKNILHFDLKGTNILFDNDTKLPLIIDFGLSNFIELENLTNEKMQEIFYVFGPDYYVWSLEIHYLSFLINENKEPTDDDLIDIANNVVDSNKALIRNFSPSFLKNYKKKCYKQLLYYESFKSFKEKKDYIMKFWKTFDNYSLSIMYLKFLSYIYDSNYEENKFTIYFTKLLLKNIDPNPENRLSITKTIQEFNGFLQSDIVEGVKMFKNFQKKFIDEKTIIDKNLSKAKSIESHETIAIRESLK